MTRPLYQTRTILLRAQAQKDLVHAAISNAPLDDEKPLEILIREQVKGRKPDQNSAMWAGLLRDIAEQAWVGGRQYRAEVWHEHYKALYLPEEFDPDLCKEGYQKWDVTPRGDRVLIGSTTQLTVKGFAQYLTQVEADGSGMGVEFHTIRQAA